MLMMVGLLLLLLLAAAAEPWTAAAAATNQTKTRQGARQQQPSRSTALIVPITRKRRRQSLKKNKLPMMMMNHSGGGVVLFLHIPKTGGTTIRNNLDDLIKQQRSDCLKNVRIHDFDVLANNRSLVEDILRGQQKQALFLELHGTIPGLKVLSPHIQKWKRLSKRNHVPFFTFTVVREPVSFYVSYFSFFHTSYCHFAWCEPNHDYNATDEQGLIDSAVPNKQLEVLWKGQIENKTTIGGISAAEQQARDETLARTAERLGVSFPKSSMHVAEAATPPHHVKPVRNPRAAFRAVRKLLLQDWDWVGTTATLSTTTLPLLTTIFFQTASLVLKRFNSNTHDDYLRPDRLNATSVARLHNISVFDFKLYKFVEKNYRLEDMNFSYMLP